MRHFQCMIIAALLLWTGPADAQPWVTETLQEFDADRITDIVNDEVYEAIGSEAPPLILLPIEGEAAETLQKYAGKTVVIQFWTTTCPPCIAQMVDLGTLQAAYEDQGVQVIYVSPESTQTLQRFLDNREIAGLFRRVDEQKLNPPYQVIAKPSTFVVDPEGRIRSGWLGAKEPETLQELIASQ